MCVGVRSCAITERVYVTFIVSVATGNDHSSSLVCICVYVCVYTQTTRRSLAVVGELLWQTLSSPSAAPEDKQLGKWCSELTLSKEQHLDQICVVCVCLRVCACNCFMSD